MMDLSTCKIKEKCKKQLAGFPRDIPERCAECTPTVKFIVDSLDKQDKEKRGIITDYGEGV